MKYEKNGRNQKSYENNCSKTNKIKRNGFACLYVQIVKAISRYFGEFKQISLFYFFFFAFVYLIAAIFSMDIRNENFERYHPIRNVNAKWMTQFAMRKFLRVESCAKCTPYNESVKHSFFICHRQCWSVAPRFIDVDVNIVYATCAICTHNRPIFSPIWSALSSVI